MCSGAALCQPQCGGEPGHRRCWTVNNGSQIVGPFAAGEIAARLHAQEMDFDSECWFEGSGESSRIADAGIFSGSGDKDAALWVFDGSTVHGPLSPGFLMTALERGAIVAEHSFICTGSTINGWTPLDRWLMKAA